LGRITRLEAVGEYGLLVECDHFDDLCG
jgi:hypothetical protein